MRISGLTKRTDKQRSEHVAYLTKKPIKELWKLKSLVEAQQKFTFSQYVKATKKKDFAAIERLEHASAELNEMETDVLDALDGK